MARAQQVDCLMAGLVTSTGAPLVGGKIYSYAAGTSTAKALWVSCDESPSASNPVILDAYGRANVYADGAYKFVVKDSADNTIDTFDNLLYECWDGPTLYTPTQGGTSALTWTGGAAAGRYQKWGNLVATTFYGTGTTGGTAGSGLTLSLPFAAATLTGGQRAHCHINNGGTSALGYCYIPSGGTSAQFHQIASANFSAGKTVMIRANVVYRKA